MTIIVPGKPQRPIVVDEQASPNITVQNGRGLPPGGTAGQALIKSSSSDFAAAWGSVPVAWGGISGNLADQADLQAALDGKQAALVSGTTIKTVNGNSLLGAGDVTVSVTDGDKGDITVSGATWTIDAGAVSLSKMADLATSTILGRATAGTGAPEALTATQVRTILNVANGATANSTDAFLLSRANHTGTQAASTITGLAAVATSGSATDLGTGTLPAARLPAFGSGDVSFAASGGAGTIANNAVTNAKAATMAANTIKANATASTANQADLAVGTNTVVGRVAGNIVAAQLVDAQVATGTLTNAKLANVNTATLKGRVTAGSGAPEDLTGTQATTLLDTFTSTLKGLAPASGGGTSNFLRADGTWAAPPGGGGGITALTGDVTASGSGSVVATIANDVVTFAKLQNLTASRLMGRGSSGGGDPEELSLGGGLEFTGSTIIRVSAFSGDVTKTAGGTVLTIAANAVDNTKAADMAANTIKGNATGATADPADLTGTQVTALLDTFSSTLKGLAPASGGGTTNFLRADGTWAAPPGGGSGSPGGASGEIQFNNAGSFGGAADVEIEGGQLRLPAIATPTAPASGGVKLFGRDVAGRILPAIVGPSGLDTSLQPHLGRNKVGVWLASGNGLADTQVGVALTAQGTAQAANVGTTDVVSYMRRREWAVTTAATNAVAGLRGGANQYTIGGPSAGLGGFHLIWRWGFGRGPSTTAGTLRGFTGFRNVTTSPTDVNPSSLTNLVGMGCDAGDTQLQFMHNDGAGTATKIPLGASFPKPTTDNTTMYEIALFSPPGTTQSVTYLCTNLANGATASGTVTTDIPSTTTLINPYGWASVGGTSSVIGYVTASFYIETDY